MLRIEPWCPVGDDPASLGLGGWVTDADDATALPKEGGAIPPVDEAILALGERRKLVPADEIVRAPHVLLPIAHLIHATQLDESPVVEAPERGAPITKPAEVGVECARALDKLRELGELAPKEDRATVLGRGEAQKEVGLATTGATAVVELVGVTKIRRRLGTRQGLPVAGAVEQTPDLVSLGSAGVAQ